jgi:hypothetical protein
MTTDLDGGFAPPPFKPEDALAQIKRSLRDLKLAERGNGFELRGKRVVELVVDAAAINVRLARTLANTPQWDAMAIKKRLARWTQDE